MSYLDRKHSGRYVNLLDSQHSPEVYRHTSLGCYLAAVLFAAMIVSLYLWAGGIL